MKSSPLRQRAGAKAKEKDKGQGQRQRQGQRQERQGVLQELEDAGRPPDLLRLQHEGPGVQRQEVLDAARLHHLLRGAPCVRPEVPGQAFGLRAGRACGGEPAAPRGRRCFCSSLWWFSDLAGKQPAAARGGWAQQRGRPSPNPSPPIGGRRGSDRE